MTTVNISVIFSVMKSVKKDIYNIETLAKLTGLNRRTVRYYIQRGVLQKPYGKGRGHYYTDEHVARIKEIQRLRKQGVPLNKMLEIFSFDLEVERPAKISERFQGSMEETWKRIILNEGLELWVRGEILSEKEKAEIRNYIENILKNRETNHD